MKAILVLQGFRKGGILKDRDLNSGSSQLFHLRSQYALKNHRYLTWFRIPLFRFLQLALT